MPLYTYEHPETGETKDILEKMNDAHVYIGKDGLEWKRIFYAPNSNIDTQLDPFDSKAFVDKTGKNKGTMGEMMDRSREMSEKRKDKLGYDPVQKKYFKEYSEKRNGTKHLLDR
jgi:hypothetical protein